MNNIFFTADTHFNHKNVIRHCDRPFSSIEEMNNGIIKKFNSVVTKKDTLYILGDFAWKNHDKFIQAINGKKILIRGSHDRMSQSRIQNFTAVYQIHITHHDNEILVMSHCPFRTWEKSHYGSVLLHGHCHGRLKVWNLSFDVGVDTHDFLPYSWDELKPMILKRKREMEEDGRLVERDKTGKLMYRQDDVYYWHNKYLDKISDEQYIFKGKVLDE